MRFDKSFLPGALFLGALLAGPSALAQATPFPAPAGPLPASPGPGLDSTWATGASEQFFSLATALPLLDLAAISSHDGVGPVSISNFIRPIGDFPTHMAMPYSLSGNPHASGQYVVGKMVGYWAARASGTFTFAVGSDDGYRLTVQGIVLLDYPAPQSFTRAGAVVEIAQPGLYEIEVDYFNGVEEGAVEMSMAPGAVGLASPTAPVPAAFALVPQTDLYPPSALHAGSGGSGDAGNERDGTVDAAVGDASADATDGAAFTVLDATTGAPDGGDIGPAADSGETTAVVDSGDPADANQPATSAQDAADVPSHDEDASSTAAGAGNSFDGPDAGDGPEWYGGGCEASPSSPPLFRDLAAPLGALLIAAGLRRGRKMGAR